MPEEVAASMNHHVPRRLFAVDDEQKILHLGEDAISELDGPIIVLGEPGMGKSSLMAQLAVRSNCIVRSAASFVHHPNPSELVFAGQRLMIDGLDELSAAQESDPINRVLGQLIKAGKPSFILSCRSADWRGAVARQDIAGEYARDPLVLSLEPFSRDDAIAFLVPTLGAARAVEVVSYLEEKGISDLFGNPLTLKLFGEVASHLDALPETRAELYSSACAILWSERNDRHVNATLARMDESSALKAAGAACAAMVLTGATGISLAPSSVGSLDTVHVPEIEALPGGQHARALVGSRLFTRIGDAEDRFKPIHRTVAEFLGARWLAQTASDDLVRDRIHGMLTTDGGVPASLRGLHAWLAQDPQFAKRVIETDPYGVLIYGDADGLSVSQGRVLFQALNALESTDPYFRSDDWGEYSAEGLTRGELTDEIRQWLFAPTTRFHLRTLILSMIRGSPVAFALRDDLLTIMLDKEGTYCYAERHDAAHAVIALGWSAVDWLALIEALIKACNSDATRLALEVMEALQFERFGAVRITRTILTHLNVLDERHATRGAESGTLFLVARRLPNGLIAEVLDAIATRLQRPLNTTRRLGIDFADIMLQLVARQIGISSPEPLVLLRWLRLTKGVQGYSQDDLRAIAAFIEQRTEVRRAIQRHVLLNEDEPKAARVRAWALQEINYGLSVTSDDACFFLHEVTARSDRGESAIDCWKFLVSTALSDDSRTEELFTAAQPFASGDHALQEFLREVRGPRDRPEWQTRLERRRAREQIEEEVELNQHREAFAAKIDDVRAGNLDCSVPISQAYLGHFAKSDHRLPPPDRIGAWLGYDLQVAGLTGLEAVLHRSDLPTPSQVAESYAEGQRWNFIGPMIAGVTERVRSGRGLADLPTDVLIAVAVGLQKELLNDTFERDTVVRALDEVLLRDLGAYERLLRLIFEPILDKEGLHLFGRSGFASAPRARELLHRLAIEWLGRHRAIPEGLELYFIDCVVAADDYEALRAMVTDQLRGSDRNFDRTRNWLAVGLIADFEATAAVLGDLSEGTKSLLWNIRTRFNADRTVKRPTPRTTPAMLAWVIASFREHWPNCDRPSGMTVGNTNSWDASNFLKALINQLASDTSPEAVQALNHLADGESDTYSAELRHAAAQQYHAKREMAFSGISLNHVRAVLASKPPQTTQDLLVIVRHAIGRLQRQLRGSDTDSIVKYWRDSGQPRDEDRCTDMWIEDMERVLGSAGISRTPQADMPAGKCVDVLYTVGHAALPIECKGQWNKDLWNAATGQLEAFYMRDWRAKNRGVYLVYWFGTEVAKEFQLKRSKGRAPPQSADDLRNELAASLTPTQRDRICVEVLDLTRS